MSRAAVADLYDLQELDLELDRRAAERESLQRALAADGLRPARETLARARKQSERARTAARDAETALRDAETRIAKHEQRLYGGGTGVRDLGTLQRELEHLKATHATQEERTLAVMLAAEAAEQAEAAARAALRLATRDWEQQRAQLEARLAEEDERLRILRAERDTRAAALAAEALRRYDTIRRTHGGRAVAPVREGTCQACRVVVSSGTLQRARAATELVTCTNCGRILYLP